MIRRSQKVLSNKTLIILFLVSIGIISRLPQLLSLNMVLDGDEAVLGLMAKHFFEGKEIPVFFYGQNYGFSFVEVLFISLAYVIGGFSAVSVKVSMLFLWLAGVIFYYLALDQLAIKKGWNGTVYIVLLFLFSPAWAVWSMKAEAVI